MVSYGAFEEELSSAAAYPYFVRVNLPVRNQTTAMLSLFNTYGWTRVGVVSSQSQVSVAARATLARLLPLFGARSEVSVVFNSTWLGLPAATLASYVVAPLQSRNIRVVLLLLDSTAYIDRFLLAMQTAGYYGARVQLVAMRFFDDETQARRGRGVRVAKRQSWPPHHSEHTNHDAMSTHTR